MKYNYVTGWIIVYKSMTVKSYGDIILLCKIVVCYINIACFMSLFRSQTEVLMLVRSDKGCKRIVWRN
jgi:hypothetical protein